MSMARMTAPVRVDDTPTLRPILALLALLALLMCGVTAPAQRSSDNRLIVLGFDGVDHAVVQRLLAEGRLPNLAALAAEGSSRSLASTNPAISPVSWSSLITGLNPGRTGIDGFLRRDFSGEAPRLRMALGEKRIDSSGFYDAGNRRIAIAIPLVLLLMLAARAAMQKRRRKTIWLGVAAALVVGLMWVSNTSLPDGRPYPVNLRQGTPYWDRLDAAGISTATMLAPCCFPAPALDQGRILCGLGVPDVMGTPGFWTVFRDDIATESTTETGGIMKPLIYVDPDLGDGRFEPIFIDGPPNLLSVDGEPLESWLTMTLSRKNGVLYMTNGIDSLQLVKDRWSEPFPVVYTMGKLMRFRGRARFKVLAMDETVRVYVEPVSFDPAELPPGVALSSPANYAYELQRTVGFYETLGWACATNALKDNVIDDKTFLEDAQRVWDEQEALARVELQRRDAQVLTAIFTVPDRLQHMFTRYSWTDRDSRGKLADPRFKRAIDDAYVRVDRFVGEVRREFMQEGDELIVASDHGFAPWRRAVNLNRLLIRDGHLVLEQRTGRRTLHENLRSGDVFGEIDWSKTRAYAVGLGKIYLNRKGREPEGIVTDDEAPGLLDRIETALRELDDEGNQVVSSVSRGERLYRGEAIPEGAADLYVGFHRGYRVSWQNCLGGADEPLIFENGSAWSGDHCGVDPALVPGILFSTLPLMEGPARVVDVGPTVLDWAGLEWLESADVDGHSLLRGS